jgi:hypothetical protein
VFEVAPADGHRAANWKITKTEETETSVNRRYWGSFSNETVFGSIDIGRLVKGFLPALGQLG